MRPGIIDDPTPDPRAFSVTPSPPKLQDNVLQTPRTPDRRPSPPSDNPINPIVFVSRKFGCRVQSSGRSSRHPEPSKRFQPTTPPVAPGDSAPDRSYIAIQETAPMTTRTPALETLEDRQLFSALGTMNVIDAGTHPALLTSYTLNGVKDFAEA